MILDLSRTLNDGLFTGVGNSADETGYTLQFIPDISIIVFAKSYHVIIPSFE